MQRENKFSVHRKGRQAVSQKATSTHYQSQAQEKKKGGERERDREIERERECERDTHRDHGWDIEYVKKRLGEHCQRDGTETNERTNEEQEKIQKRPIHVTDTCGSHKKQST